MDGGVLWRKRNLRPERTEKSSLPKSSLPMPAEFAEMGKQRIEGFVNAQTELLEKLQESNRQWFDRMQSEANLASEFASKLTAARSIPDAMTACQEWASRRFKMMAEDREHLLSDCQKFTRDGCAPSLERLAVEKLWRQHIVQQGRREPFVSIRSLRMRLRRAIDLVAWP